MPLTLLATLALSRFQVTSLPQVTGVTVDSIGGIRATLDSLTALPKKTTVRVVFDPLAVPGDYTAALQRIHAVAGVMAEPVDSEPTNTAMTLDEYRIRLSTFMDKLKPSVDIWEIGNEVNGDWTGPSKRMSNKITAGYDEARARGLKTAVTLFYCDEFKGTDREMVTWASTYLSGRVKKGVDYVLVSFYPTTSTGAHPDWPTIFANLAKVFPAAKLGFGELGLATKSGALSTNAAAKAELIRRYYRMSDPLPGRYIGGYFWWTFRQDATPKTKSLWSTFADVLK